MRSGEACAGGVIYLMRQNGELVEMNERGYDTEDLLQGELGVPSEDGSSDRWSADHLFVDQDTIPPIVARSSEAPTPALVARS
jgi:hypothetical protein